MYSENKGIEFVEEDTQNSVLSKDIEDCMEKENAFKLLNSINEKCARIRGAFQFDDRVAKHYYVDGLRGEPKKIALPRDLVVWE